MSRDTRQAVINTLIAVGAGLLAQGVLYVETTRDDIHDLKRDMAEVRCQVALLAHNITLPVDCKAAPSYTNAVP